MRFSLGKRSSFSYFPPNESFQNSRYGGPLETGKYRYTESGLPGEPFKWLDSLEENAVLRKSRFDKPSTLYGVSWGDGLLVVSTCNDSTPNYIQILNDESFIPISEAIVPYPCTKVLWDPNGTKTLATSGDCLRLWKIDNNKLIQGVSLSNSKNDSISPITSFDWNKISHHLAITSSIDTTCTLWDLNALVANTQLIAHDQEVYDVQFIARSSDIFASVGADGSVRIFDLRSLDHSTIIYDPPNPPPLLRIATCPYDSSIISTFAANSNCVLILDMRSPGKPLQILEAQRAPINAIAWCPVAMMTTGGLCKRLLATASDDGHILLWNITNNNYVMDSVFIESSEVNNIAWSPLGNKISCVSGKGIQEVRL